MPTNQARVETKIPLRNAFVQWVRDFVAGGHDGLVMWERYEALSRLSDRDLARYGITRADFPCLAVKGEHATIAAGRIVFDKGADRDHVSVFGRIAMLFSAILNVRGRMEDYIVSSYKGREWDDSAERELNNELANYRCSDL